MVSGPLPRWVGAQRLNHSVTFSFKLKTCIGFYSCFPVPNVLYILKVLSNFQIGEHYLSQKFHLRILFQ